MHNAALAPVQLGSILWMTKCTRCVLATRMTSDPLERASCLDVQGRNATNLTLGRVLDILSTARGAVAQLGERYNRTVEVRGSSPLSSTSLAPRARNFRTQSQRTGVVDQLDSESGKVQAWQSGHEPASGRTRLGAAPAKAAKCNLQPVAGDGSARYRGQVVGITRMGQ